MSYDLVVWQGERPGRAETAEATERRMDRYDELWGQSTPPTPDILAFLREVVALWSDDPEDEQVAWWSATPVAPDSGAGDTAVLSMTFHDRLDRMVADIVGLARARGLQVYDPQSEELLT